MFILDRGAFLNSSGLIVLICSLITLPQGEFVLKLLPPFSPVFRRNLFFDYLLTIATMLHECLLDIEVRPESIEHCDRAFVSGPRQISLPNAHHDFAQGQGKVRIRAAA